ncbi:hypothetical protein ACQUWY_14570, partial [Ralstonia pseudosolanacearum]
MTPQFHPLRVAEVRGETADTISLRFDVPDDLREAYRFTQGQFLTLRSLPTDRARPAQQDYAGGSVEVV